MFPGSAAMKQTICSQGEGAEYAGGILVYSNCFELFVSSVYGLIVSHYLDVTVAIIILSKRLFSL